MPKPAASFAEARLQPSLTAAFRAAGFAAPTPIQAQVWPIATQGLDIIGIAKTGSGKTLAFLVPAYRLMASRRRAGIQARRGGLAGCVRVHLRVEQRILLALRRFCTSMLLPLAPGIELPVEPGRASFAGLHSR